ncbi:MAG: hypothetical protein ACLP59_26725 [Bryobacteraceae bacterium]
MPAPHYNFPTAATGAGQTVGLLEFGNHYDPADIHAYFLGLGIPPPEVIPVYTGGAAPRAYPPDGEATLDIAVAGAVAPGARIVVYFAPSTEQGWIRAVSAAIHDTVYKPSVLSISWGWPELEPRVGDFAWTHSVIRKMSALFREAAHLGITIFAATGNQGASSGMSDGQAHVIYPASDPWVTACGGAMIRRGTEFTETAWKMRGVTGGGISDVFPLPAWQESANIPASVNRNKRIGRGIPDVAGYAAGYDIIFGGRPFLAPGTSGVAPLWAGLIALVNESLGHSVGFLNPHLYGEIRAAGGLRGITGGDNNFNQSSPYYLADTVWNACTGLGSPDGMKIVAALRALQPVSGDAR